MDKVREALAEYAHRAWSGWMKYLFSFCMNPNEPVTGPVVIPQKQAERWLRQMNTEYEDLPEVEKKSDREEADRMIKIFKEKGESNGHD